MSNKSIRSPILTFFDRQVPYNRFRVKLLRDGVDKEMSIGTLKGHSSFMNRERIFPLDTPKALEDPEGEYRTLFENFLNSVPLGIICTDAEGTVSIWNKAAGKIFGWKPEEIIGTKLPLKIIGSRDDIGCLWGKIAAGKNLCGYEVASLRRNGDHVEVCLNTTALKNHLGENNGCLIIIEDVTERNTVRREMLHVDRMNLIGEMARSIGHEIRNPLTVTRGYLQFLMEKPNFQTFRKQFETMIDEMDRANEIITEFLFLAKDKAVRFKLSDLNSLILEIHPLIEAMARASNNVVRLELQDIPLLELDEREIRQMIINLSKNGLEAMPEGGQLVIRTEYNPSSERVFLSVTDEGPGMPREIIRKLGTPFLTTKENGTGLGLAVCCSVAARHGASINVDSSTQGAQGTTLEVEFHTGHRKQSNQGMGQAPKSCLLSR